MNLQAVTDDSGKGDKPVMADFQFYHRQGYAADDMLREHSYMEVSLRGGELVSVSLTEVGATCASLLDEGTEQPPGND